MAKQEFKNKGPIYLTQEEYNTLVAQDRIVYGQEYRITDYEAQDKLVSGENIKTINNTSLLGSGNIELTTEVKTLNGTDMSGSGNKYVSDLQIYKTFSNSNPTASWYESSYPQIDKLTCTYNNSGFYYTIANTDCPVYNLGEITATSGTLWFTSHVEKIITRWDAKILYNNELYERDWDYKRTDGSAYNIYFVHIKLLSDGNTCQYQRIKLSRYNSGAIKWEYSAVNIGADPTQIETINNRITAVENRTTAVENRTTTVENNITALTTRMDALEENYGDIEEALEQIIGNDNIATTLKEIRGIE